jgi:3D (Asp-Asp-Asp) domain-containing protein
MFRVKILAAVFYVVIALAEELSFFEAESAALKVEETLPAKPLEWPPLETEEQADALAALPEPTPTITVSASIYHPEPGQTDSTPLITADGSRINPKNPKKHRWIAVSRDLHSRWGGEMHFGDSLWVTGISEELDGLYVVRDIMNKRMHRQIDILVGKHDKDYGKWRNVQIARLD